MNGLPALAENLAARGRNGDSMLVHMTPGEVKGLQALALSQGGSLSINPDTGLVEANFLKRLLPMIAGAALTIGSGGVINPYMAGAMVGGFEGIRTGDLSKGLMAGLGGFGGAGLGAGLSAAGATASGASGASTAAQQIAAQPAASMAAANLPANVAPTIGQNLMQGMQGIGALGTEAGRTAFMGSPAVAANTAQGITGTAATGVGGGMGLAKYGMSAAMPLMQPEPMTFPTPEKSSTPYEGPYTPSVRQTRFPTEEERRRTSEFTYFTPSNPVPFEKGGAPVLEDGGFVLTKKAIDGLGKGDNKTGQKVASRGLGAVPIKGPGHGTSDSIKTTIEGKQPALVSNGEAYVPKKQVEKNGGAKKFYALMRAAERRA